MKAHWYKVYITECPVCGDGKTERERVYGKKPKNYFKTHVFSEHYDWCLE